MTTEQLHTIKIDGLPDGWRAVEARIDPMSHITYTGDDGNKYIIAKLKLEKIQTRRIVLEETEEFNNGGCYNDQKLMYGDLVLKDQLKIWRVVEEEK